MAQASDDKVKTDTELIHGLRLTPAHCAFLLSLPPDGSWKRTSAWDFDRHGVNAFRGFGKLGLTEGYYQEEMRHRLTDEGQRAAATLLARAAPKG
jgi:hypothetical protein